MKRRDFIQGATIAVVASNVIPFKASARTDPNNRIVHVAWSIDESIRIHFSALNPGDVFFMHEPDGTRLIESSRSDLPEVMFWKCKSVPTQMDGVWGCVAEDVVVENGQFKVL